MPTKTSSGFVYAITNDNFPGWVKVGRTTNPSRRLRSYQTGDPTQSYRLAHVEPVADCLHAEWAAFERLKKLGYPRSGEWFQVSLAVALRAIRRAAEEPTPSF
jgi:T5orf172 domain